MAQLQISRSPLICPVCGKHFSRLEKTYRCENGHSYDISKYGYVNLLPPRSSAKRRGDDARMVRARAEFLDKGFYAPLRKAVAALAVSNAPKNALVCDVGCGEGYYTAYLYEKLLAAGKISQLVGIDISTDALHWAHRRTHELILCAASAAHLPLENESADLLLNIFSPFEPDEYGRVLKKGGKLLRVVPLTNHLWELKQLIYDTPLPNPPMNLEADGFRITTKQAVRGSIHLTSSAEIMALFEMTPYYYKTGAADQQKAQAASELITGTEFGLVLYEKL